MMLSNYLTYLQLLVVVHS